MKTNSYTRIFVMTLLFFGFSAVAQDIYAANVTRGRTTNFISRWTAGRPLRPSKIEIAGSIRTHETKSALTTLCTRKYAGEQTD
jgi:hypothetical protein